MYQTYYRLYQFVYRTAARFLPWRKPELLTGANSVLKLPAIIEQKGVGKVLIVTDHGIVRIGLMDALLEKLQEQGVSFVIYDKTVPNPTIDNIEEALAMYKAHACQGIIAFGGGSSIDCAKGVGARIARPDKEIPQMKGQLKVLKPMPPFFTIPTTAGTGSEATVVAVVSNPATQEKYAINDTMLIPHVAVLDPLLTVKLPPHITAATGIDALTHAVEAYIGQSNTAETIASSEEATKLIFDYLFTAYSDGENVEARSHMQRASYLAGVAFTRAYVGYVHAIAHTLGAFYNVPHGLANAVILPYVLKFYGEAAHKPLAKLADIVGVADSRDTEAIKALKFIDAIEALNEAMGIPKKFDCIQERDIPLMVSRAHKEANPLYPVPKILSKKQLKQLYYAIKK